ncbi:MAG: hypothetical protein JJE04_21800 [Acidobacteriia bacterium]|nr:hypothetical protein [Terriglobia bacterium]
MTRRLYYDDSYLRNFRAKIVEADANKIYLEETAFYPASGGQPHDTGSIAGALVIDVVDEGDRIAHLLAQPSVLNGEVECIVDWERRFYHMQQHTGQHLLSAVLMERFRIPTLSFHLGREVSTIDVETASLDAGQVERLEQLVNERGFENRPVEVGYQESGTASLLRKPSERQGLLRVISIQDLDRSACGGTHVRSTGEIGPILIRKLEKIRGNVRIEFVCGLRAVGRARKDFDALSQIARCFSAPLDDVPGLVTTQTARMAEVEKRLKKLLLEQAAAAGKSLHGATPVNSKGLRVHIRHVTGGIEDEARAEAQGFAGQGEAVFLILAASPASVLLAVSSGAPFPAGPTLKALLEKHGGRGGGNPQMAQGSLPSAESLAALSKDLESLLAA